MVKNAPARLTIRLATNTDIEFLHEFDPMAQKNSLRRAFIQRTVDARNCFVAVTDHGVIVGYGVLGYSFYEQGFVSMLYVHPEFRRCGIGSKLLSHFESICETSKIFTSTNLSNLAMQSLLTHFGYSLCGVIHHLDEEDPEIVFVKYLKADSDVKLSRALQ